MRWLHGITYSAYMNFGKLQEMVRDKGAWCAEDHEVEKRQTWVNNWRAATKARVSVFANLCYSLKDAWHKYFSVGNSSFACTIDEEDLDSIICCPLLLLLSIFPSIKVFSNELALHLSWPKYWSFSFIILPANEYSGMISFKIDLLAVQGTLKSLLQHNLKQSVLQCSIFFMVQCSHPWRATGKTTSLMIWTFVGKVMSQLFYELSRLVIVFLPCINRLLISWLWSPSVVILEPKKIKM